MSSDIDIEPRSDSNPIDPVGEVVPVAVLGSDAFDVANVDVTALAFGPSGAPPDGNGQLSEDVNDDGFTDLVSHYQTAETGIALGDTEACLDGETLNGVSFQACDAIVVPEPSPSAAVLALAALVMLASLRGHGTSG